MERKNLSLVHLVRQPTVASDKPPLLLLLHGYGSNERDLFGIAPYIDGHYVVVSVRAPRMVMTGMYAWFDLSFLQTGISFSYQQAETTRDVLVTFINEVVEAYGADPSQVYLAGFSQGAIMSAAVTLKRPDLIAGVVLMSGSASPELVPADIDREQFRDKPVLIIHGTRDTTLPIHNGRITRDIFAKLPVALTYHEYQMGHEVNMEGLMEVSNWLGKRVERAG